MLFLAFLSPILGAIADIGGHRRLFFRLFTLLGIVSTLSLTAFGPGMVVPAMIAFILSEIGYEGGCIFYDSFVTSVSKSENIGRISGYGFAAGYAGGILSLLISLPFIKSGDWSHWPIWIAGTQFLVLGLPALFLLRDSPTKTDKLPKKEQIRQGLSRLLRVWAERKKYPDLFRLLLSFLIYFNGIATVFSFAAAFAFDTLGFSTKEIIWLILVSNIVAIPGALLGGWLCDRIGGRRTILITLLLWITTVTGVVFVDSKLLFYVLAGLLGVGLGSTQGATRALYAEFVPEGDEGQYFGLKGICGKFAAVGGPFLFGWVSYVTKNQRIAVASLLLFFIVGFFLVLGIDEGRGKQVRRIQS